MKKLIFLLAVAAAVGFFLRRKEASELLASARNTVSSWREPAATKAEEVAEAAVNAADSATSAARNAAKKAEDVAE